MNTYVKRQQKGKIKMAKIYDERRLPLSFADVRKGDIFEFRNYQQGTGRTGCVGCGSFPARYLASTDGKYACLQCGCQTMSNDKGESVNVFEVKITLVGIKYEDQKNDS